MISVFQYSKIAVLRQELEGRNLDLSDIKAELLVRLPEAIVAEVINQSTKFFFWVTLQ